MPWDFIANIGQQQNIGQGKSYWLSGPYTCNTLYRAYHILAKSIWLICLT